ncbi:hypothetical protein [Ferruginivarius sediminum]|uniref:DUF465 domain-containing protein n=1 Tax=Ferruginivarius sediminum TaxID=2661937 RepID=A0A369T662_9PROT|nr:hypothetical protein [Ferruginivarius sediminum]RDD60758.1 hypothetical protein DRB17_16290 [Ferruginivarius sediminum]
MTLHLNLIERFPEYRERIKDLLETNATFTNLAKRYGEVAEQVREGRDESDPDAERLKRRKLDLETEMLSILQEKSRP